MYAFCSTTYCRKPLSTSVHLQDHYFDFDQPNFIARTRSFNLALCRIQQLAYLDLAPVTEHHGKFAMTVPTRFCVAFTAHTPLFSPGCAQPSFCRISSHSNVSNLTDFCRRGILVSNPTLNSSSRWRTQRRFPSACAQRPISKSYSANASPNTDTPLVGYDFRTIEPKWQKIWAQRGDYEVPNPPALDTSKPKYYVLDMFPYPSGAGLHVGHPEGYTATDILARYYRKRGFNVLHPMGWDAFGLPAEQYAISTGTHPAVTTEKNINRFRQQLQALGFSYDWTRELRTTDPSYYKWTQWIFLKLWEKGLAYQDEKPVNWCPALGTVLANEEVIDGLSERGGHPVERRLMKQWVLRITAYAERLLEGLEDLDWPENVKEMQRNWIGKSVGVEFVFDALGTKSTPVPITVFTTRPETVCGVACVVVAPEHPALHHLVSTEQKDEVDKYVEASLCKSDRDRTGEGGAKDKTGVWTGSYAKNPISGEAVPVWVADFVLGGYGTAAVMSVPAHDARDYEFANKYDLPIKKVVDGDIAQGAFTADGKIIDWGSTAGIELDGLMASQAKKKLMSVLEEKGLGKCRVNYKLRDWLFSRQRYWGEPFPIVFVNGEAQPVQDSDLPVKLPQVLSYKPSGTGQSPLANVSEWMHTTHGESLQPAIRETNTMPQWAGSCWYYLRFIDPENAGTPVDPKLEKYWMPVDLYVGGVEHAVLHLLYARFWHKVLYDVGVVSTKEPFRRLVNQGMILGEVEHTGYQLDDGNWVSASDVDTISSRHLSTGEALQSVVLESDVLDKRGESMVLKSNPKIRVFSRAHKMSKSRGNVVNPDSVIEAYGADSLRCYLMFMGPLEQVKPWGTNGVQGMSRFLGRVWRLVINPTSDQVSDAVVKGGATKEQLKALHQTIKRVTDDVEGLRFNTALACMMEYVNTATKWEKRPKEVLLPLISMLSTFAPHICEELWERLGETHVLAYADWPEYRSELDYKDDKLIVVQINGKVRSKMAVPFSATKDDIVQMAKEERNVAKYLSGGIVRKEIYVPNKVLNLIVS